MELERFSPDLIYAPRGVDFHPEHLKVAQLVAQCIGTTTCVRIFPIQVPLTSDLANCVAAVQDCNQEIRRALDAYASQRVSVSSAMRLRHYTHGNTTSPASRKSFARCGRNSNT